MDEQTEQDDMEDKLKQCIDNLTDKRWVSREEANTGLFCICSVLFDGYIFLLSAAALRHDLQPWNRCDRPSPPNSCTTSWRRDASPSATVWSEASRKARADKYAK